MVKKKSSGLVLSCKSSKMTIKANQVVFIFDKIYILQSEGGEMIKYCLLIEKYFPISCSVFSSPVRAAKARLWRCFIMFYSACQPKPSFTILEKLTEKSGRGNSLFISNNMLHRFSFVLQIETDPYCISSNPNIIFPRYTIFSM